MHAYIHTQGLRVNPDHHRYALHRVLAATSQGSVAAAVAKVATDGFVNYTCIHIHILTYILYTYIRHVSVHRYACPRVLAATSQGSVSASVIAVATDSSARGRRRRGRGRVWGRGATAAARATATTGDGRGRCRVCIYKCIGIYI